jgi:hypothetical protein
MPSSTGVQFTVESIEGAWREGEKHCTLVWAGKGVDHKDAMLLVTQTWARAEMFHPIQTFVKSEAWTCRNCARCTDRSGTCRTTASGDHTSQPSDPLSYWDTRSS